MRRSAIKRSFQIILIALISLVLVFLLLGYSGCKTASVPDGIETNKETTNINIGSLKGPTSIGMIKLHDEKPSLGDGITTNYEIAASPDIMISKLLSGDIDMAVLPTNVAVKLYNKGLNCKLAAIVGYGALYLLQQNIGIKDWQDLKREKINVISKGSTPDVILRYLLKENNLSPGIDIELDYSVEQTELAQLMIAGKKDISILPEPFVTLVLDKNPAVSIAFDIEAEWEKSQNGMPLPMSCFIIRSHIAGSSRDIVDNFLNKYRESIDWVNENIDEASILVEKYDLGMDAETARKAIPRCNIKFSDSAQAMDSVKNYIQTILDFSPEDVGGKQPDEAFFY